MTTQARRVEVALLGLLCVWGVSCGRDTSPEPSSYCEDQSTPDVGTSRSQIVVDGICREYWLHLPPSYDASRPVPLLLALHGQGSNPLGMEESTGLSGKADSAGFVVAYPAGLDQAWNLYPNGSDVRFVRALISRLEERTNVDRRRVYLTGFAMGGGMAHRAVCELADLVAAVAPVSGTYRGLFLCGPQRPVPVFAIHGTADTDIPPSGRLEAEWPALADWADYWVQRNACAATPTVTSRGGVVESAWLGCAGGSEVRVSLVEGLGHVWWSRATDEVWAFLERHSLPE
jgi:polyhydroxybutyrate depolymerase